MQYLPVCSKPEECCWCSTVLYHILERGRSQVRCCFTQKRHPTLEREILMLILLPDLVSASLRAWVHGLCTCALVKLKGSEVGPSVRGNQHGWHVGLVTWERALDATATSCPFWSYLVELLWVFLSTLTLHTPCWRCESKRNHDE